MHPVAEVGVSQPGASKKHLVSRGRAAMGMARRVVGGAIRLHLDDPRTAGASDQGKPEQADRAIDRIGLEPG